MNISNFGRPVARYDSEFEEAFENTNRSNLFAEGIKDEMKVPRKESDDHSDGQLKREKRIYFRGFVRRSDEPRASGKDGSCIHG